jgi:hypothetical protein
VTVALAPHLRRVGFAITLASLIAIGLATLWPQPPAPVDSHFCVICGSFGTVDALLNVLLFVPLGIGLSLLERSDRRAILAMCALSIAIETAQFFVIPGRDSTLGDVLANTLGGALGFMAPRHWRSMVKPSPIVAGRLAVAWAILWFAVQIASGFAFSLSLPDSRYYGQIGRKLGSFAPFHGQVSSATVGGVSIPDSAIEDSHQVRERLRGGSTVAVAAVVGDSSRGIAPILRIADDRRREILLVAQNEDAVVFGVITGASILRLRRPIFSVPRAFSVDHDRSSAGDSVQVIGRYSRGQLAMETRSMRGARALDVPVRSSLGWILWLPFQWLIEGTQAEAVAGWLWTGILVLPFGYWVVPWSRGRQRGGTGRPSYQRISAVMFSLVLITLVVATTFGLALPRLDDWVAASVGFLAGGALGARLDDGGGRRTVA